MQMILSNATRSYKFTSTGLMKKNANVSSIYVRSQKYRQNYYISAFTQISNVCEYDQNCAISKTRPKRKKIKQNKNRNLHTEKKLTIPKRQVCLCGCEGFEKTLSKRSSRANNIVYSPTKQTNCSLSSHSISFLWVICLWSLYVFISNVGVCDKNAAKVIQKIKPNGYSLFSQANKLCVKMCEKKRKMLDIL